MLEVVTYRNLTEPTEEIEEQGAQVYKLDVDNIPLGFLYLTPDSYTLAWNGLLDFRKVDDEARGFFYRQLDEQKKSFFEVSHYNHETKVSLIVKDRLLKYSLNDPEQLREYAELLRRDGAVSFIRYDFLVRESPLRFGFTAENPHGTPHDDCELAVMLPRSQPVTRSLLRWIISRHTLSRHLRELDIDLKASGDRLSELVGPDFNTANQYAIG